MVSIEGVVNDTTEVRLFIWNSPDSEPVAPTHSLTLTIPSSTTRVWFDISPYIRAFIAMQSFTEVTAPTAAPVAEYCYCHVIRYLNGAPLVKEEDLICMEGYGYHSEELNPQSDTMLAQGNYYVQAASTSGALGIFQNLVDTWQVRYTGLSSGDTTALTISNEFSYTPYLLPAYVNEGNKVEILVNSVVTFTYNFILQDECKYTPLNCDFVNKQGAWERLVFFKKSSSDMSMTNEEPSAMFDSLYAELPQAYAEQRQELMEASHA